MITTGGLGPTADDLTAEVVAEFAGRPLELDAALEGRIWEIVSAFRGRWPDVDEAALRAGNRKQALVPRGAVVLEPVGTAPGLVVPVDGGPVVVVLPGPPRELQPMWEVAVTVASGAGRCSRGAGSLEQRIMRVTGVPESQLAQVLRELDPPVVARDHHVPAARRARDRDGVLAGAPAQRTRRWSRRWSSGSAGGCSRATGRRSTRSWPGCCSGRRCGRWRSPSRAPAG